MATLYDHLGRPVQSSVLNKELAAPAISGVRTVWTNAVTGGLTPARLASLLQSAASGSANEYLTLAEEMEERDLHYRCEIGKRRLAVTSLPIVIESASDAAKDVQLADEIRALVQKAGFRGLLKDLLDALGKGYSVAEIMWQRGSKWVPASYEWRDPRFFTFDRESRRQIRLLDPADTVNGIELAPYKFMVHLPHLKTGLPIRGGFARVAAWSYLCKNYAVKDWLAFAEVFGMPLRLGKYRAGTLKEDISILKMAVENLGTDAAAVIPETMQIEFVEAGKASSSGGDSLFVKLADWLDTQVSRGILGQSATTQGTPGKLGSEDAQAEVRTDIRDDDAVQLAETINRDLVRPFIDLNFGPQENYPQLQLKAVKKDDLIVLTTALEKLVPLGLEVEQSVIRDKYGLPDPAKGARLLGPQQPVAPVAVAGDVQTAANSMTAAKPTADKHPVQVLTDQALAATDLDPLMAPVKRLLAEVTSLEEFRDRLLGLYADMPVAELGILMQKAFVLADLAGRFDVSAEVAI
jgi:phage gp29-like protein